MGKITSKEIAEKLGLEHIGNNIEISTYSTPSTLKEYSLVFAKEEKYIREIFQKNPRKLCVITKKELCVPHEDITYIISTNPRLDFIKALMLINTPVMKGGKGIHPTAIVEEGTEIGENCEVGAYVYIGRNTRIGNNVCIYPNVVIYGDTKIGNNVTIHSGSVIGKPGF
ncbi:MAG: hypothetical protein ACP5JR_07840, partial [Thermoplasmata archaeon]